MYQNSKVRMTSMAERIASQSEAEEIVETNWNKLQKDLKDEIFGGHEYLEIAGDMSGDKIVHECLVAMAKDEYTHAEFIISLLEENNITIPEEEKENFESLRDAVYNFRVQ